jgi:hypothetical protein
MKFKPANVQIWFLDEDLRKSAEYLCGAALDKTIEGCVAALTDVCLYAAGVRSKRAYQYYFAAERRQDTLDRFFPDWPFRRQPQMKYYTSRAGKWTRMCREHAEYVLSYMEALLDEHQYRRSRPHVWSKFAEWARSVDLPGRLPPSGQKKLVLPWKSLKTKFRRRDVIEGYRLQYMDTFLWQDPIGAYGSSDRDVPDFVVRYFGLDTASMVT